MIQILWLNFAHRMNQNNFLRCKSMALTAHSYWIAPLGEQTLALTALVIKGTPKVCRGMLQEYLQEGRSLSQVLVEPPGPAKAGKLVGQVGQVEEGWNGGRGRNIE